MGTTGTATHAGPSARGNVRFFGESPDTTLVLYTTTMSASYATGGDTLSLPGEITGMDVKAVVVCNPIPVVAGDRIYTWDGNKTTPKIQANVISTAAQVANATDLSAVTLTILLILG
jgi:hypothetical protein